MRALRFFAGLCVLLPSVFAEGGTAALTGKVQDTTGAVIPGAIAELRRESDPYTDMRANTDLSGVFRFGKVAPGVYTLKLGSAGFETLMVKGIRISAGEQELLPPTIHLSVSLPCSASLLDYLRLLPAGELTGKIRGSVDSENGPVANANVILLCKTGVCGETSTDLRGSFEFVSLPPREFAVRVRHSGFYSVEMPEFYARAGVESVYLPIPIARCRLGICASSLRPKKPVAICE
jgi:protocatechuate 3,4-dioxygenase beta subunit